MQLIPIKRALISVSDKTGVVELAQYLSSIGCEIISTGGTRRKLTEAGIDTIEISEVTGNPEAFGGRMKTISFNIESALLFDRVKDKEEAQSLQIESIDLVVCNLYPFKKVLESGGDFDMLIENIDIGGPTMIRAAAKNFKYVTTLTSPDDYEPFMEHLKENQLASAIDFRQRLMTKAFNHTADYDALIAETMDGSVGVHSKRLAFTNGKELRYGENSHQSALSYDQVTDQSGLAGMKVLHGKALSFNNLLDINGALEAIKMCNGTACSVIKHSNPCGLSICDDQRRALELAWAGDPISAFGSIIAFNTKVSLDTVTFFGLDEADRSKRKFVEVVIAPAYDEDALDYLRLHKNLRIIIFDVSSLSDFNDYRFLNGILLAQDPDINLHDKMEVVTTKQVDVQGQIPVVEFGLQAIKTIKSNSIVIVRSIESGYQLLGMGAGQPNRLIATQLAIEKATQNLKNEYNGSPDGWDDYRSEQLANAWLISDAFFPFPDNVELAASKGIRQIVQPGGSIKDKQVIDACDTLGVSMIFTGLRHFKH